MAELMLHPFDAAIDTPMPNADGSVSTEVTRTVFLDGRWVNVPSLWWGDGGTVRDLGSMSDDQLAEFAKRYEQQSGRSFPRYTDINAAEEAAVARSRAGGAKAGSLAMLPPIPAQRPLRGSGSNDTLRGGAMTDNPRPPLRVQDQYNPDVDPRLIAIIEQAAAFTPFQVELRSGFRPGDSRQHGKKNALDINLIDPATGAVLPNYQSGANFREYEQFAQAARAVQMANFPELENDFRWGGYFGSKKGPFGYGALDLMHFDLAGSKIGMGQGSWEGGLSKAMKTAYNIPDTASVGMGQNARSKTYLAELTPGGFKPGAPDPAAQSPGLAALRNNPMESGAVKSAAIPFPATRSPLPAGNAVDAITQATGAEPPDTRLALTQEPRVFDPSIPVPAAVPSFRRPAPVAQPPIDVAEVYRGTPMQTPGAAPAPVPQRQQTAAEIYEGFPMRPEGPVPQTMQTAEQIYEGIPLKPETAPKPSVAPNTAGVQFSPASTDPETYYPGMGMDKGFDPVVDPLADQRLADFKRNIATPDGPADLEAPKIILAGNNRAEQLYQAATGKPTADANMREQRAEQMSPALKAARERLAAARTKKATTQSAEDEGDVQWVYDKDGFRAVPADPIQQIGTDEFWLNPKIDKGTTDHPGRKVTWQDVQDFRTGYDPMRRFVTPGLEGASENYSGSPVFGNNPGLKGRVAQPGPPPNVLVAPTPVFMPGNRLERLRGLGAPIPATMSNALRAGRNALSLVINGSQNRNALGVTGASGSMNALTTRPDYRDPGNWVATSNAMPSTAGLSPAMAASMGYVDPRSL